MQRINRACQQPDAIQGVQLASAYVPIQNYCGIMSPHDSLMRGTTFPELFSPYRKREYVGMDMQGGSYSMPNRRRV